MTMLPLFVGDHFGCVCGSLMVFNHILCM